MNNYNKYKYNIYNKIMKIITNYCNIITIKYFTKIHQLLAATRLFPKSQRNGPPDQIKRDWTKRPAHRRSNQTIK